MFSWLKRKYANWFEAPTIELKEITICYYWIQKYGQQNGCSFQNLKKVNDQWPDCEIKTDDGRLYGIEVTELVDRSVLERVQIGEEIYRIWSDQDIIRSITEILNNKNTRSHGGKYHKLIVLIHTAEFDLLFDRTNPIISAHVFNKLNNIDEAYLVYQYEPNYGYPVSILNFGA